MTSMIRNNLEEENYFFRDLWGDSHTTEPSIYLFSHYKRKET